MIYGLNKGMMSGKDGKEKMTQYSISFAIGGLLGDVFFHTMPHMNSGGHNHNHHDHHHDHSHEHGGHSHNPEEMVNNLLIIIGIIAFFLMERFTHSLLENSHSHSHSHDHKHNEEK
jgi:zinc transporter ZupT